jgi:hypothetical protein
MLLTDRIYTAPIEPLNLVTICGLQGRKDRNVIWLGLVRCMRWEATQLDVICEAKLQNLQRLVGTEAVGLADLIK